MNKAQRIPMLGEKSVRRSWQMDHKASPIVRPWKKLIENPALVRGQRTLEGRELESVDSKVAKMEMLMRREQVESRLDGEDEIMAKSETSDKKKPIEFFREGAVSVSVWANKGSKGDFKTFSMTRSYKKGDTWAYTTSLGARDLPKAIKALQMAIDKYGEEKE